MPAHRKIVDGKAVICLHIPQRRALEKARDIAKEVALLGDERGTELVTAIDSILSDDEEPSDGGVLRDDQGAAGPVDQGDAGEAREPVLDHQADDDAIPS